MSGYEILSQGGLLIGCSSDANWQNQSAPSRSSGIFILITETSMSARYSLPLLGTFLWYAGVYKVACFSTENSVNCTKFDFAPLANMRAYSFATLMLSMVSAIVASPVPGEDNAVSDLSRRGNGDEILYLVTCNGQPHGSVAAYYAHWQDSQTYGAHYPDAVSAANGGIRSPGNLQRTKYVFSDSTAYATINVVDPGWYQVAGDADNSFGTHFTCRMDNGRQLFSDCFSNYYCQ
ncbi:hypothetical protein CPB83DRAFT_856624 [Crepidotus variabilis]|uniref:Uncharacterized protein n=1 Tax=Crepidotus variabilis TaxID=179855 RepID=A0A9P6EE34_9AGAR|nr:hypothetical protein CPB83DRAFT_856624 [Crepidotus variabilis]